jgi:hypothetical protein
MKMKFKNDIIHQSGTCIETKEFDSIDEAKAAATRTKKEFVLSKKDGKIINTKTYLELITNY